uniref:Cyclase/dehydrase n=1 Tax=Nocardiopsis sp. TaxID=310350 RepID=A0A7M4CI44_9ACTN|nr:cyclase/dehydrase [Nocardiopsis sp.]
MPLPQENGTREVEHTSVIQAPAEDVYRLIADVQDWPLIFPPSVHVEHESRSGQEEVIRIWATANGLPKTWTSRRRLDPRGMRVDFRQVVSSPPVASMGGAWTVEALAGGRSLVRLSHDYRALDQADLDWIDQAVDRNSESELDALKRSAEAGLRGNRTRLTFEDTVRAKGRAEDLYAFVNDAGLWRERLPHVARVVLTEDTPGLQTLEMDTRSQDGSVHTTESVRVCFPYERIVYKQLRVPPLMTLHTGAWSFTQEGEEAVVTSRHTVVINEARIGPLLGADKSLEDARDFVRSALGRNSLATMNLAKDHVESGG